MKNPLEEDHYYYNEDYPKEDQEINIYITSPLFARPLFKVFAHIIPQKWLFSPISGY